MKLCKDCKHYVRFNRYQIPGVSHISTQYDVCNLVGEMSPINGTTKYVACEDRRKDILTHQDWMSETHYQEVLAATCGPEGRDYDPV